jgi:hypothetical protein
MMGTVDSVMYPGTDQFQRFQYPSRLPAHVLARIDELATRLVRGVGFTQGMFNIEMRIDPRGDRPRVIEINPRAAGQFYDLFERVDGYSPFDVMLDLHSGRVPRLSRGAGRDRHAASFVLRDLEGAGLARWPSRSELRDLQARNPDVHAMVYPKRGADLARELKWLGSYRYAVFNLGAPTMAGLLERFARLYREITFHPPRRAFLEPLPEPAGTTDPRLSAAGSADPVVAEGGIHERGQDVVPPGTVDEQVSACEALLDETQPLEQAPAAIVLGPEVGHDPVQAHGFEHEGVRGPQALGHEPAALVAASHLVAQVAGVEGAAHDVGVVARAHDGAVQRGPARLHHEARGAVAGIVVQRRRQPLGPEGRREEAGRDGRGPAVEVAGEIVREETGDGCLHAGLREPQHQALGLELRDQVRPRRPATAAATRPWARA